MHVVTGARDVRRGMMKLCSRATPTGLPYTPTRRVSNATPAISAIPALSLDRVPEVALLREQKALDEQLQDALSAISRPHTPRSARPARPAGSARHSRPPTAGFARSSANGVTWPQPRASQIPHEPATLARSARSANGRASPQFTPELLITTTLEGIRAHPDTQWQPRVVTPPSAKRPITARAPAIARAPLAAPAPAPAVAPAPPRDDAARTDDAWRADSAWRGGAAASSAASSAVSDLLSEWRSDFEVEREGFASAALCIELKLRHALRATAAMASPNRLRLAVVNDCLDCLCAALGRYRPLLSMLLDEMRRAVYATWPPRGAAVGASRYLASPTYFELLADARREKSDLDARVAAWAEQREEQLRQIGALTIAMDEAVRGVEELGLEKGGAVEAKLDRLHRGFEARVADAEKLADALGSEPWERLRREVAALPRAPRIALVQNLLERHFATAAGGAGPSDVQRTAMRALFPGAFEGARRASYRADGGTLAGPADESAAKSSEDALAALAHAALLALPEERRREAMRVAGGHGTPSLEASPE